MILGFKKQFVDKIKQGTKIHSIREDKNRRWRKGMKIHFATGVRTKSYNQFWESWCRGCQDIWINPYERKVYIDLGLGPLLLSEKKTTQLIKNDGFDNENEFWEWFSKPFVGRIIHWTNFRYL